MANDPDSYYKSREIVPGDMLGDIDKAKIVITNYHAFKLRQRIELSAGGRALLQGRGEALDTLETEGQMLQRVMPDLMGLKNIAVMNDEAHHCYREKLPIAKRMQRATTISKVTTGKKPKKTTKRPVSGSPASNASNAGSA